MSDKLAQASESLRSDAKAEFGALLATTLRDGDQSESELIVALSRGEATIKNWCSGARLPQQGDFKRLLDALWYLNVDPRDSEGVRDAKNKRRRGLENCWTRASGRTPAKPKPNGNLIDAGAPAGEAAQPPVSADPCTTWLTHRLAYLRAQSLSGVDNPGSLHASFVNLQLRPDRAAQPGQAPQPFDSLDALLAAHPHTPVWLLIGDPGGGKSTLLFDLELRRAAACLADWQSDAKTLPELCVRVSLADYHAGTSPPPAAWLAAKLAEQHPPHPADSSAPPTLADLVRRARVRLLLDGLNEIRADNAEARLQAQQEVMHWAARWGAGGQPAPLFTIRRIDLVPLSTGLDGDAPPAEVDVLPWQDDHIERYCERRFPGQNNPVWQAIRAHERSADLLALMRNPFNLKLQSDLFRDDGGRLAPHRGALLGRIGLLRLDAALVQHKLPPLPADLLHPSDASRVRQGARPPLADDAPTTLHQLRLRGRLLRCLAALCRRLHERDGAAWSRFVHGDAVLHDAAGPIDDALQAAQALLLLQDDRGTLRMAHQLWQEYFAAMDLARGTVRADWPDLATPPQPTPGADAWELPTPTPSEWDQCAQLAVQIADDPAHLLAHLAEVNLALAGRAALALGPQRLQPSQLAALKQRLLARSQQAANGLAQRIEAGELLGLLGDDIRYESGTGPDGNTAYLVPRWASHWLPVPAGKRRIGGLEDWTDSADTVEVDIPPGLQLAFAPVTNAEFRCFIDAEGYGDKDDPAPPPWWQGEAALRWWRGEVAKDGQREAWLEARRRWLAGEQDQIRRAYFSAFSDAAFDEDARPRLQAEQADFDRWLDALCAPERQRKPDWWDHLRYANPLQPVVGVSLFEAQAYARWLSHQTGRAIRLPHEAEWEVAARGGVQRAWPWDTAPGRADPNDLAECMNFLDTRVRRSTPVGVFPAGQSPEGFVDLAGQVWEWTDSAYTPEGLQADKAMSGASADDASLWRAVRGGGGRHRSLLPPRHPRPRPPRLPLQQQRLPVVVLPHSEP